MDVPYKFNEMIYNSLLDFKELSIQSPIKCNLKNSNGKLLKIMSVSVFCFESTVFFKMSY